MFLKEKQVTQATGTYAYRAYLETLLNYGPAAKESQLTAAMFYKDTAGKMDVADPIIAVAANDNHGLKKRYEFNKESGVIEMAGPLFCDVFRSERLLLSFVDLKVVLNRNVNEFCLMSDVDDADYRVKLTEAYLKKPLQLSYTAASIRYIEAYLSMFSGTGKLFYDAGNGVSRGDFKDSYALYAADLTPDMCGSSDHFNVVQRGNLAGDIKFTTAPTAAVSLVCYGEFENTIHIDSERNVIYDYSG